MLTRQHDVGLSLHEKKMEKEPMQIYPKGLNDVTFLQGSTLSCFLVCSSHIEFDFDPDGHIDAFGDWHLLDPSKRIVDRGGWVKDRGSSIIHQLIGQRIASAELTSNSVVLRFENGYILTCFDRFGNKELPPHHPGNLFIAKYGGLE